MLLLGMLTCAHAEDNPEQGDSYATSQKKALEQFKSMRQESSLSESAGEPGVLDLLFGAAAKKQRAAASGKVKQGKAALKKELTEKKTVTEKKMVSEKKTETEKKTVTERSIPAASDKSKSTAPLPKQQELADKGKKGNSAAGGGTARSPDGTTRSER